MSDRTDGITDKSLPCDIINTRVMAVPHPRDSWRHSSDVFYSLCVLPKMCDTLDNVWEISTWRVMATPPRVWWETTAADIDTVDTDAAGRLSAILESMLCRVLRYRGAGWGADVLALVGGRRQWDSWRTGLLKRLIKQDSSFTRPFRFQPQACRLVYHLHSIR